MSLLTVSGCSSEKPGQQENDLSKKKEDYYERFHIRCADKLIYYDGFEKINFGKEKAFGPPTGKGDHSQSLDVFSLGREKTAIFQIENFVLKNKTGIDFKIFENTFKYANPSARYWLELATVEISEDRNIWYGFSPQYNGSRHCPDTSHPCENPNNKRNLVGLKTVITNYIDNPVNPRLPEAGGDGFDLDQARRIIDRLDGNPLNFIYEDPLSADSEIRFIKLVDGGRFLPDSGEARPDIDNGADIDSICIFL